MDGGRKECTLLWRIQNYSYCWHWNGWLSSPLFSPNGLEGTEWCILLCPKGGRAEDGESISLFLWRSDRSYRLDAGPNVFQVKFELSILAEDGSSLHSEKFEESFHGCDYFGSHKFLRRDDVLLRRKSYYLPNDTLTVRCKLWRGEGDVQSSQTFSARTRIMTDQVTFLHTVESFSTLQPNVKQKIEIPTPSHNKRCISSSLYFTAGEEKLIIEIVSSDHRQIVRKCKLFLKNRYENALECGGTDYAPDAEVTGTLTLPLSLSRQDILNKRDEYLPGNKLTLLCECSFSNGIEINTIEEISPEAEERPFEYPSALDDMKALYVSQRFTDVELKTETKSFPAHKNVLCARSPVFEAMMSSDMRERNTARIQVDDLDDETVEQLLLFLYSDTLDNLQWGSAARLYFAADKYQIGKLKATCSSFLVEHLDASNAGEVLLLADAHSDSGLLKAVQDFILHRAEEVFGSDEWGKLIQTNPLLASKTMQMKFRREN